MRLLTLSVAHQRAPVQLREKLAISGEKLDRLVHNFRERYPRAELAVLCTCNRSEFYVARGSHQKPTLIELSQMVAGACGIDVAVLEGASQQLEDENAVRHLFRVAVGLESMVLGEPQILGQVKRAYAQACDHEAAGAVLHRVFQGAITAGKKIRRETGIDQGRVSVGSVAVDFARQVFERFCDKTVVGVGAGEMAKLALQHLVELSPARLWVANRSVERARELVTRLGVSPGFGGARPLTELEALLVEADILVTSTGSNEPIITRPQLESLKKKRRNRPLFILDLAVPRDVDEAVAEVSNTYLYNIDDLQEVVAQTQGQRSSLSAACEAMVDEEVEVCVSQLRQGDIGQMIRKLRHRLHEMGDAEQQRTLRKLAANPDQADQLIEEHTRRLVNKILHLPLSQLDHRQTDAPLGFYAAALRELFQLDEASQAQLAADAAEDDQAPARSADSRASSDSTVRTGT